MEKPQIATHMTLVIDPKESMVINGLINMALMSPTFLIDLEKNGLLEQFMGLSEQFTDKVHKLNWCTDPDCEEV